MFWRPGGAGERVATRGAEWFVFRDGLIAEIRSYYQQRPQTTELAASPTAAGGYSGRGAERSGRHEPTPLPGGADGVAAGAGRAVAATIGLTG